jgi:hypothetical protein
MWVSKWMSHPSLQKVSSLLIVGLALSLLQVNFWFWSCISFSLELWIASQKSGYPTEVYTRFVLIICFINLIESKAFHFIFQKILFFDCYVRWAMNRGDSESMSPAHKKVAFTEREMVPV